VLIRSRSRGTGGAARRRPFWVAGQSPCFVETQVRNGQFQRVYPAAAGSFDCTASNLITVKQGS